MTPAPEQLKEFLAQGGKLPDWTVSLFDWVALAQFKLERNAPMSRAHHLMHFVLRGNAWDQICTLDGDGRPQIFLVQHNWAAAFAGDKEFDSKAAECRLPAPICLFEFTISGRAVIALANDERAPVEKRGVFTFYISCKPSDMWLMASDAVADFFPYDPIKAQAVKNGLMKLEALLQLHVKAICIALEAEVAETEVVRIPHKLNAARKKHGKPLLPDYHVINLANRKRYAPAPADLRTGEQIRNSPRLHFRRGHWRHYSNYKTWIKWQLVGNVDLGFIDKDYKL